MCQREQAVLVHEMLPGAKRMRCFPHRQACLALCVACNQELAIAMPIARQLAYKMQWDRWWFDLDLIRVLYGGGVLVTMDDVRAEANTMGFVQ